MRICWKILLLGQAPWFIIPADDKWFTRLVIANIIVNELEQTGSELSAVPDDTAKKDLRGSKKIADRRNRYLRPTIIELIYFALVTSSF